MTVLIVLPYQRSQWSKTGLKRTANVAQHCLLGHNRTHKITYEVQTTFALTEDFYFGLWTLFGSEDILMGLRYRGIYLSIKELQVPGCMCLPLILPDLGLQRTGGLLLSVGLLL